MKSPISNSFSVRTTCLKRKRDVCVLFFIALFFVIEINAQNENEVIFHVSHEKVKLSAPYSDAVQAGGLFFLSGQIGINYSTKKMVTGGIKEETEMVIKNLKAVLEHHNLSLNNVVKCTVILSNMDDFEAFNEVYSAYFTNKPARTSHAAIGLPKNAKLEMDIIAVRN